MKADKIGIWKDLYDQNSTPALMILLLIILEPRENSTKWNHNYAKNILNRDTALMGINANSLMDAMSSGKTMEWTANIKLKCV